MHFQDNIGAPQQDRCGCHGRVAPRRYECDECSEWNAYNECSESNENSESNSSRESNAGSWLERSSHCDVLVSCLGRVCFEVR